MEAEEIVDVEEPAPSKAKASSSVVGASLRTWHTINTCQSKIAVPARRRLRWLLVRTLTAVGDYNLAATLTKLFLRRKKKVIRTPRQKRINIYVRGECTYD